MSARFWRKRADAIGAGLSAHAQTTVSAAYASRDRALNSVASQQKGCSSVLDRSVGREDRARGRYLALDEPQRPECAVFKEDAFPAAKDDGVDHQPELVDQVVLDQGPNQLRAPDDQQIVAILLLQRRHRLGDVAPEQPRVVPLQWLGEGRRPNVLPLFVP